MATASPAPTTVVHDAFLATEEHPDGGYQWLPTCACGWSDPEGPTTSLDDGAVACVAHDENPAAA